MKKLLLGLTMLFAFSAFAQNPDPSLPIDMEDPADDAWVANGVDYSLETVLFSPNQVGKIVDQGTVQYDSRVDLLLGTYIDMETPSKTFTFEFYTTTTDVMTGLFQISNEASAGYPIEMTFTTDGAIGWQTITLDFTNADNGYPWCQTCPDPQPVVYGQYARVSIFTNFGSFTTGTYYFDDIAGAANGAVVGADPAPASPPIPQPTAAAEDVISVFSDVYTGLATAWHPAWSQSTVYSDEIIVGTLPEDHISKLKYFSYDAVLLDGASNPTNVESMEYVHFDIWSHDETSIRLFLLTGPEPEVSRTLVPGQWNSFDIPLTEFTGAVLSGLWGIKFESGTYAWPNGTSLVYLDNIYFWKTAGAGTLTFDPQNGATNVAVDIDPSLSFSIPVAMANDDPITNGDIPSIITFKETDASGADVPFTGTINPGEDVITVIPTTDLDLNQAYYMALNNEVIKYQGGPLIAEQSVTFTTVSTPLALPVTFEDSQVNYGLTDFGGTASNIIVDPSDPANNVVETIKNGGAADWAGTTVGEPTGLTPAVPFAPGYTRLSMRVYSPAVDVPVLFKLEVWDNTSIAVETISYTTVANEWETLVFDFSNENAGTDPLNFANPYNKPVVFFNFGVIGGGETYYWDDIEFINIPSANIWTGANSSNWFDGGNWAGLAVPTATDDVIISAGMPNDPEILGAEAECADLEIATAASLTILPSAGLNATGTVLCDGDLMMASDALGNSSSFRDGGIDPFSSGIFTYVRIIEPYDALNDHLGWHYISSPIANFDNWDMYNYWINTWDETATGVDPDFPWVHMEGTGDCIPAPQTAIGIMEGWSVRQDYDYACGGTNPGTGDEIIFNGPFADLHSGNYDRNYTAGGGHAAVGYNLMGNPYASFINMDAFAGMNVHIWNGSDDTYLNWADGGDFTEIPPTQGFFVYKEELGLPVAGNVALTNANRVFGAQTFEKSTTNQVVLLATGNDKEDKTYIRFSENATAGYDNSGMDAYKLLGTGTAPQIYTVTNGIDFSINTLSETPIVPMSFFAAQPAAYTIEAVETGEFATVVLEDRFYGVQTDLLTNSYTFNYTVNDNSDRFFIHFTPLAAPELSASSINMWSNDHKIYVQAPEINGDIVVFNMMGQEVTRAHIQAGLNVVPVSEVNAFYVVKITGSEVTKTGKVYVK